MEKVHYFIVVHGMGEPKKGETVLPVINRFLGFHSKTNYDLLSLAKAIGNRSADRPWLEFKGIQFPKNDSEKFTGEASFSGKNIRFVEFHWNDISNDLLDDQQAFNKWIGIVIDRLRKRSVDENNEKKYAWIVNILVYLRYTIYPLERYLAYRFKELSELIFGKFLGDVQLYAESARHRGRAVAKFHQMMEMIQTRHDALEIETKREAEYTLLAHSLGTIMSLDALLFACASDEHRNAEGIGTSLFTDYKKENDPLPDTSWIKNVRHFVTIGSPIDKFLTLWWDNYNYLKDISWIKAEYLEAFLEEKINHYNYSDEQDPVGHELDVMYNDNIAIKSVFGEAAKEEKIYNRYAIPGKAHVDYWKDQDLFNRIIELTMSSPLKEKTVWFSKKIYKRVLRYNYSIIPLLNGFIAFSFMFQFKTLLSKPSHYCKRCFNNEINWEYSLLLILAFVLTNRLMYLMVEWRQLLSIKEANDESERISKERQKIGKRQIRIYHITPFLWAGILLLFNLVLSIDGTVLLYLNAAASGIFISYTVRSWLIRRIRSKRTAKKLIRKKLFNG